MTQTADGASRALVAAQQGGGQARRGLLDLTMAEVASLALEAWKSGVYSDLKTKEQAAIKIQTGLAMGLPPALALRNIYVVGSTPSFSAALVAARIKASRPRYNYTLVKLDAKGCELAFWEDGQKSGVFAFTEEDAKRAGLLPAKPDSPWNKWPKQMYFSRAVTGGQRIYCPDVMGAGVPAYTPEELGGEAAAEDVVVEVIRK